MKRLISEIERAFARRAASQAACFFSAVFLLLGCSPRIIAEYPGLASELEAGVGVIDTGAREELSFLPYVITLAVGNGLTLSATGGQPPYTYSVVTADGGVIDSNTGAYTAPGTPGTYTLRVTDQQGAIRDVVVTVNPAVSVSSASITIPAHGGYTWPFAVSGGVPPYTYDIASGPGSVDSGGLYAPSKAGASQLRVQDAVGNSTFASISNMSIRTNGAVHAALVNGTSLYIGGSFTAVNPFLAPKMVAVDLNTGSPVLGFDLQAGFNGRIEAAVVSGNSIYVGGSFSTYKGIPAQNLAKLDLATGNLDTTFTQATGISSVVNSLAISGSSLYVGGSFTSYRGAAVQSLAKLDLVTGDLDTTFTQATGINDTVNTLAVSGSSLYVGGFFGTYRGVPAQNLAKLDLTTGNLDTTFTQATGMNATVHSLAVAGSSLYAGGWFSAYRGATAERLAKLDLTTGDLDTTFTQASGMDSVVFALVASGSSLYAGGGFTTYRGVAAQRLVKLDLSTGNLDTTFTQAAGMNNQVEMLVVSGASLYVGGNFSAYRGTPAQRLAKVDLATGNLDTTFTQATGLDNSVTALAVSGSSLYVGGGFGFYRGVAAPYLAKLDLVTETVDPTFTQATGLDNSVTALAVSGSSLYVGGAFTLYRGVVAQRLAKLDLVSGNLDTTFTQATGMGNQVNALAISGSSLYAGGGFTTYRGVAAQRLVKLDLTTGDLDPVFTQATGMNSFVYALAVSGSSLFVGGSFGTYRGIAVMRLAKLDLATGDLDATFPQATGLGGQVNALVVSGASLFMGGTFSAYQGFFANRLAKIDLETGALDTTFTQDTGMNNQVRSLAVSGSSLYVGGLFTTYRELVAQRLAKVDLATGNLDTDFTQATGMDSQVNALAISGSSLFVGGNFTTYRGASAYYLLLVDILTGNSLD